MQTQQIKASQLCLFVSFASRLTRLAYKPEKNWVETTFEVLFSFLKNIIETCRNIGKCIKRPMKCAGS